MKTLKMFYKLKKASCPYQEFSVACKTFKSPEGALRKPQSFRETSKIIFNFRKPLQISVILREWKLLQNLKSIVNISKAQESRSFCSSFTIHIRHFWLVSKILSYHLDLLRISESFTKIAANSGRILF